MRILPLPALLAAAVLPFQPLSAQTNKSEPATAQPGEPPHQQNRDSAEEITKDSARDLKDNRYYNKPGATRAQYDADWQACRLIARGSMTPGGSSGYNPYLYNPYPYSPVVSAAGGIIGSIIARAIQEGEQRRYNRRQCLLIKGWRLVEPEGAEKARLAALPEADRRAYFDTLIGAQTVNGTITERKRFYPEMTAAGPIENAAPTPGALWFGKGVDTKTPLTLDANEALVVMGLRRSRPGLRIGADLFRYDRAQGNLATKPKGVKNDGITYRLALQGDTKKQPYEVVAKRITAGDYIIDGARFEMEQQVRTNCFGAPLFTVQPGAVVYIGDYVDVRDKGRFVGKPETYPVYVDRLDDAKTTLASTQPALAEKMKAAAFQNGATYSCAAVVMDRWDIPGVPMLAPRAR